jgi:hypothetical protein
MTRYPFYRRLGGPQGQSGQVQKISPPPGFDPWTVQLVVSRYIDYAILAHKTYTNKNQNLELHVKQILPVIKKRVGYNE